MDTNNSTDRQAARNAYVECADWADAPRDEDGEESDTIGWHPTALTAMDAEMDAFLDDPEVVRDVVGLEPAQVGHDFWLTRNGHGTGFWDRGLGAVGDRLSVAAHAYGEASLYVGDDGWQYVG